MTKKREKVERFVFQKLHSIFSSKHQHCVTGQQHDRPLMASAPVWMRRPLHDRTVGPSACEGLCLSPQHNPTQLKPVVRRPLIKPAHWAKNNSRGFILACDKINMSQWVWARLQLSIFNHRNQNKQKCEADFKSPLCDPPCMSPPALFSIIQSHLIGIISALFPVSCLDV